MYLRLKRKRRDTCAFIQLSNDRLSCRCISVTLTVKIRSYPPRVGHLVFLSLELPV